MRLILKRSYTKTCDFRCDENRFARQEAPQERRMCAKGKNWYLRMHEKRRCNMPTYPRIIVIIAGFSVQRMCKL